MANTPMKPVFQLVPGTKISTKFYTDAPRVSRWKYADECPSNFSPLAIGDVLEIFELNTSHPVWVKAYLPNRHNSMFFKISGEELSPNFFLA